MSMLSGRLLVLFSLCSYVADTAPISSSAIVSVSQQILIANNNQLDIRSSEPPSKKKRRSISYYKKPWPKSWDGTVKVPYIIDPAAPYEVRQVFEEAITHFNNKTCIRFKPRSSETNYIRIIDGDGCWSYVGLQGNGQQDLSLMHPGCTSLGTAVHEMLHSLTFHHSMVRADRDLYIKIDYSNIPWYYYSQFDKHPYGDAVVHGQQFDINSVMMYSKYAFAIDPTKPTITYLNDPNRENRAEMWSPRDIIAVNRLYNCNGYQMYE